MNRLRNPIGYMGCNYKLSIRLLISNKEKLMKQEFHRTKFIYSQKKENRLTLKKKSSSGKVSFPVPDEEQ